MFVVRCDDRTGGACRARPALPAAAIVVWLATLTWTFSQFKVRLGRLSTTTSAVLLAEVAALGSLQTAPDMAQSLYWQTGMLTYLLPLVLATFLIGWIRRAIDQRPPIKPWTLALSALGNGLALESLADPRGVPDRAFVELPALILASVAQPRSNQ